MERKIDWAARLIAMFLALPYAGIIHLVFGRVLKFENYSVVYPLYALFFYFAYRLARNVLMRRFGFRSEIGLIFYVLLGAAVAVWCVACYVALFM